MKRRLFYFGIIPVVLLSLLTIQAKASFADDSEGAEEMHVTPVGVVYKATFKEDNEAHVVPYIRYNAQPIKTADASPIHTNPTTREPSDLHLVDQGDSGTVLSVDPSRAVPARPVATIEQPATVDGKMEDSAEMNIDAPAVAPMQEMGGGCSLVSNFPNTTVAQSLLVIAIFLIPALRMRKAS